MVVYIAGPLFSQAEKEFNLRLRSTLEVKNPGWKIILPQVEVQALTQDAHFADAAFSLCLSLIDQCDVVLAVLEGADADSGTCVELGYAYKSGKPIIGLRTDFRSSEDRGLNLMVSNVCRHLFWKTTDTLEELVAAASDAIAQVKNAS